MTISTTSNKAQWQGDGATTVFSFGFEVDSTSQVALYYEDSGGSVTLLAPSTYQLAGLGSANGGTVTYPLSGSPIASSRTRSLPVRIQAERAYSV